MIPDGTLSWITELRVGGPYPGSRTFSIGDWGWVVIPSGYRHICSWGALGQVVLQYEFIEPKRRKK